MSGINDVRKLVLEALRSEDFDDDKDYHELTRGCLLMAFESMAPKIYWLRPLVWAEEDLL